MTYTKLILYLALGVFTIALVKPEKEKTITCDGNRPQVVRVANRRITVINFPFRPKDVVPGEASFDFKQIKNDLVIKSLKPDAHTNIAVYLDERRCAFDLITVKSHGDDILVVRDPKESQYEVKFNE